MRKAFTILLIFLALSAFAGERKLFRNVLVVPKCSKPPVIDGRIGDDEWSRAVAFTGFQHIFGWMTERQPVGYVTYDDRKLYIALDSRFPKNARLRRVARTRDHKRLCGDDAIEVWIAPDFARPDALEYQFLGNSLAVIQDFLRRPNLGNSLMRWNGEWDFKCTSEPGRWQSEIAIDLAELNLQTDRDFGLNLCRDYAKYIFTGWTCGLFRNFARASFGGSKAPAAQLLGLDGALDADMKARVRVCAGDAPADVVWRAEVRLETDGSTVAAAECPVTVAAGQIGRALLACTWADKEPDIKPYEGLQEGSDWKNWVRNRRKVVKIVALDKKTGTELLRHQFLLKEGVTDPVQTEKPRAFEVSADMYPSFGVLRASADVYDFDRKDELRRIAVTLRPAGKEFAVGCGFIESFKLGYGETMIRHLPLQDGKYEAVFQALGPGDEALATEVVSFEKKSFPWQGTHMGVSDEVIFPFTPLQVKQPDRVLCWGREYRFGAHALSASIVTRGVNVLARPVAVVGRAAGRDFVIEPTGRLRVVESKPGIVRLRGYGRGAGLGTKIDVDIEYDGMMKFRLRLRPDEEVNVERLALVVPLHDENARLFHACGESIRLTNRSGYVPKGQGVVWTSKEVPNSFVLGTFIPYFWLGDYDRGICWMADNDRGWSVDDAPAVEFIRQGKTLTARVNFFSRARTVSEPVDIVFALMAGPPRPEPKGWRMGAVIGNPDNLPNQRIKLGWFCYVRTFQGFGKPPDMEKYLAFVKKWRAEHGTGWGVNMSPNDLWGRTEENIYYQAEWYPGYPSPVRNDYVMFNLDAFMKKGWIDGLYADDVYPVACGDLVTGCGYVRDDGKIQSGYSMFALRDFFKRAAVLFRKNKCKHGMLVHMTDSMIMPAYCFWDGKHDNEWGARVGEGRDHIDAFPLGEICARSMSRQYGMAATWHTAAPGHGDDLACLLLLHDIIGRVEDMDNRVLPAKLSFGQGADDVEFLGYWVLQPDVDPEEKGLKMSAWVRRKRGTALLAVANLGSEAWSGELPLPFKTLGLPPNAVAADGEENHPRLPLENGQLRLDVPRHNYRLVLLGPPDAFSVDQPLPGADLPGPANPIEKLCDDFNRAELGPSWRLAASPVADGEIEIYRNRLCVKGRDYKFAAAERDLGMDGVRVQVRVERRIGGNQNRVGLALVWKNGSWIFAGPGAARRQQFNYFCAPKGGKPRQKWGSPQSTDLPGRMHQRNWVRIDLHPETIAFYGSADGKTWVKDWEVERPPELSGPPALLRLGKNPGGEEARHMPPPKYVYFDDLVVGRSS